MRIQNYLYLRSDIACGHTLPCLEAMRKYLHNKGIGPCAEIIANGPAGFSTVFDTVSGLRPTLVSIPSLLHLQGRLDELFGATHVQALDTGTIWSATYPVRNPSRAEEVLTAQMQAEIDAIDRAARTAGELRLARGIRVGGVF